MCTTLVKRFIHRLSDFYPCFNSWKISTSCTFDLYILHYVATNVLQVHLDGFRHGWCHHSIRTEGSRTPMLLWIIGPCTMDQSQSSAVVENGLFEVRF